MRNIQEFYDDALVIATRAIASTSYTAFAKKIQYPNPNLTRSEKLALNLREKHRGTSNWLEAHLVGVPDFYEPEISRFLRTLRGNLFIDIGANRGHYSFILSHRFKKIIAVEPYPPNQKRIANAIKYRSKKKIILEPKAISDKVGMTLLSEGLNDSTHSLESDLSWKKYYGSDPDSQRSGNMIPVQTETVDSLTEKYGVADLIKLDVEGHEFRILYGVKHFERVKSWEIECHDQGRKEELWSFMSENHYYPKWLDKVHLFAERNLFYDYAHRRVIE